jgi:hypothetical protein
MHVLGAWQLPPAQMVPVGQSPSAVQAVHIPEPRQILGLHDVAAPALQAPPPQVLITLLSPLQAASHWVPAAPTAHFPAPSQLPVLPQIGLLESLAQPPPGGG